MTPTNTPDLVPHAPLTDYYADEQARAGFVQRMFDTTATDYDRMERILGLGTGSWYRGQALARAGLAAGMTVLDVGIGTGLVAREAVRIVGDPSLVQGLDPSPGMLASARELDGVRLTEGRAEALPFPDASFDFLSMGYALRHIADLDTAFREFHRVLKPGGRICLLEITLPERAWARRLLKLYMKGLVPAVALVVARSPNTTRLWRYYWDTIEACLPPARVVQALQEAGFSDARRHIDVAAMSIFSEYQGSRLRV